ncbi:MAG: hypothetical protein JSR96_06105 [Proteobacteria bacterium]|nr:hypothetical protein [Pseudomonadota bacterium]
MFMFSPPFEICRFAKTPFQGTTHGGIDPSVVFLQFFSAEVFGAPSVRYDDQDAIQRGVPLATTAAGLDE